MAGIKQATSTAHTTSNALLTGPHGQLRSARFADIYFSSEDGAAESRHVFLQGNNIVQRWESRLQCPNGREFCIGELGFGTGLNFSITVQALLQSLQQHSGAGQPPALYYYATEAYPLTRAALEKAIRFYNPCPQVAAALLRQYPDAVGSDYLLRFSFSGLQVVLVLLLGDSAEALDRLEHYHVNASGPGCATAMAQHVDAWYLDGFAPACNPDMWQRELFARMARHSRHGSTAATFSVARTVRDNLAACGFELQRAPGFGRKREMLCARFTETPRAMDGALALAPHPGKAQLYNNLFFRARNCDASGQALVVGAGIAGCCTAARLASMGWQVTIVDADAASPAAGASGNRSAILYARTAAQPATLADWHEAAFHFATHFYAGLGAAGELSGMLRVGEQLGNSWLALHPECASRRNVSAAEATQLAGVPIEQPAIFYPRAGVLRPAAICRELLDHPAIVARFGQRVTSLRASEAGWQLQTQDNKALQAKVVVLACAAACSAFAPASWLPLKTLRGQTTVLQASNASRNLAMPVCGEGYITPAVDGLHEIGASYGGNPADLWCREQDHRDNLRRAAALSSAFRFDLKNAPTLGGRAGLRCVTPDYLPLAGSLAEPATLRRVFAGLEKDARRLVPQVSEPLPGLYVNCGYGSHGFTSAPLLAEIVAAEISGRPLPISNSLRNAVHPSRFLLRDLVRGTGSTTGHVGRS